MIIEMSEFIRVETEIISLLNDSAVPVEIKSLRENLGESDSLITLSLMRLLRGGYIDLDTENGVIYKTLKCYQPEKETNSNLVLV